MTFNFRQNENFKIFLKTFESVTPLTLHILFHCLNPEMACFCDIFLENSVINQQSDETLNEAISLKLHTGENRAYKYVHLTITPAFLR